MPQELGFENGNFENGLDGWSKTGTAFDNQPTYGNNVTLSRGGFGALRPSLGGTYWHNVAYPIGLKGDYWIGTYDNRPRPSDPFGRVQGDEPTGTLTSSTFRIEKKFITFLVGGGNDIDNLKIELLIQPVPGISEPLGPGARAGGLDNTLFDLSGDPVDIDTEGDALPVNVEFRPVPDTARTGMNLELLRREWWDVSDLVGQKVRIRITDNSSGHWGHINVADIRFQNSAPPDSFVDIGSRNIPSVVEYEFVEGDPNSRGYVDWDSPIWGFVDLHAHPVAHLGFGEQLIYGALDGDPTQVLNDCSGFHGGLLEEGGNEYRRVLVEETEKKHAPHDWHHSPAGYPVFAAWPAWFSVTHHTMWYEWVRRAWQGGQRILVALTVSSHVLADAAETAGPNDDLRSMNKQLEALRKFAEDHGDFVELALDSTQLRDIVRRGKLAIVIGTEMDNIGNFYDPADKKDGTYNPNPSDSQIKAEIDRLYDLGVRYIFPVHLTNNVFGGAAVYDVSFNVANKYNTGKPFEVENTGPETGISFQLRPPDEVPDIGKFAMFFTGDVIPGHVMPSEANYPRYHDTGSWGHRNRLGLTPKGELAIRHMMKKGMMIDIDHLSEKAVGTVLSIANELDGYPLNSGHNGFREGHGASENNRTREQYMAITGSGGMIGFGFGGRGGDFAWAKNMERAKREINPNQLAIGTDANGMYPTPAPWFMVEDLGNRDGPERERLGMVQYSDNANAAPASLERCRTGEKSWDYNTDGFAHYGLFPDMLQFLSQKDRITSEVLSAFLNSAEYFARMWQQCEFIASRHQGHR